MITSIRYHPLIERDTDAHEYAPLFVTTDEVAVRRAHSYYLEEFVNGYYRLCAGKARALPDGGRMTIACPVCGNRLENITAGKHTPTQALYAVSANARETAYDKVKKLILNDTESYQNIKVS